MKYITIIKSFYPSLSKQEKKVADYILEKKGQISYQSLNEISKQINVGEATIVRFVKKIGFVGFQDFKLQIAKEDFPIMEVGYENYIDNIQSNITDTIINTKALVNKEQLDKSISLIAKSSRLFLYGVGASGLVAMELENKLLRFGKAAKAYTDSHFQIMNASIANNKDVIIAVSLSGTTADVIESLTLAKNNGAKIVAITNHILSPMAKLADSVLLTAGRETLLDGGSLIAKMSQLYVIDILCTGYALKYKDEALKMKHNTAKSVSNKNIENKN